MFAQLPVTMSLAVLGWAIAVLALGSRTARVWLKDTLQMPPPSTHDPLAALDAIRGLAALWVSLFHYWQWTRPYFSESRQLLPIVSSGERAITLFVILSGFLIWRSVQLIRTREDLARYARNRFLRIFPLYAAISLTLFFAGQMSHVTNPFRNLASDMLMARSFGSPLFAAPQAWSLYVEVIFYLAAPVVAVGFGKRAIPLALMTLLLFSASEYSLVPREFLLLKFFFFGILAAEIFERYRSRISQNAACLMFITGVALLMFVGLRGDEMLARRFELPALGDDRYRFNLGIGFSLLLLGAIGWRPLGKILSTAPLRILGIVSYSVFMWHGLLILADFPITFDGHGQVNAIAPMPSPGAPFWMLFAVVVPAVFACGIVSFLCIERPFLLMRNRTRRNDAAASPPA